MVLIIHILVLPIFLFISEKTHAQISKSISYQAIVNDVSGNSFKGNVGIRIGILHGSEEGAVSYSERHLKTSDENGFVSLRIGEADQVYKGKFDTINWANGPYFLKTEIAPGGGYAYSLITVTELTSVPYAIHAITADSVINGYIESDPVFSASVAKSITRDDTLRWNAISKENKFKIGDFHRGGIIFYLEPGGESGLIASLTDVENNIEWGISSTSTQAISSFNGFENTKLITKNLGEGNYAAKSCSSYSIEGHQDWYLPSKDEFFLLIKSRYILNKVLEQENSAQPVTADFYWTSTERNLSEAYIIEYGNTKFIQKNFKASVRAIKAF